MLCIKIKCKYTAFLNACDTIRKRNLNNNQPIIMIKSTKQNNINEKYNNAGSGENSIFAKSVFRVLF